MKNFRYILTFLSLALVFSACEEETYEFGDIIAPSNLQITAQIIGQDADNPFGDGSGTVNFTATASDVITYKFVQNGSESMAPAGTKTYNFGVTGTHTYAVTVLAIGTGGVSSSATIEVEVLALYAAPADLLTMLTSDSSRTWRLKAEGAGHFGVGPADSLDPIWWAAAPYDKDGYGAYDDTFTFNSDGTFTHTTNDTAYGQAGSMTADLGGDFGLTANGNGEFENYPLANYSEGWALSAPGGQETLTFSNIGYHGFYVGGDHSYAIISRTENEMRLRTIGADGLGWFAILIAVE